MVETNQKLFKTTRYLLLRTSLKVSFKVLSEKLPFRNNSEHPKTGKKKKICHVRIQKGRQIVIVHKEMQNQQCRKHDNAHFSVEKHQHQPDHHQEINGKNNEKIPPRDMKIFMLQVFIHIYSKPHYREQHQSCKC